MTSFRQSLALLAFPLLMSAQPAPAEALAGLWKAKRWFGPEVRGTVIVQRNGDAYVADLAGHGVAVRVAGGAVAFDLPDGLGSFRGKFENGAIAGQWYQPNTVALAISYVSPVHLRPDGADRWTGVIAPLEETFTFYLDVRKSADGTMSVILSNPERDYGAWLGVQRLVRDGDAVKLLGKRDGEKEERELVAGTYDAGEDRLTLRFPSRGRTYEFTRAADGTGFLPRPKDAPRYSYRPPPALQDGWATGTLDEAGIDRAAIETLIRTLSERPMESRDTPEVHALLIARGGKLVLEEYFHGEHRDKLHDTRSASKSIVALIAGAAIESGAPLTMSTPVYSVMHGGTFPPDLDPRKRAMTLEHLLTMTSGYHCDDWNREVPFNEEAMTEQDRQPDYYRYTLDVPMAREPGASAAYCALSSNLALGMVGRATGEYPLATFDRLVARPMNITRYAWPVNALDQPYGGGGAQFRARDFLKFGQLLLDEGVWKGQRIVGAAFAARATSPLYRLGNAHYGYLWWTIDYPYEGRTVRAFYAGGVGGQAVVMIPELRLGIATFGANYSSAGTYYVQQTIIPKHILPAVRLTPPSP